jgi:hypothetical protein
MAEPQSPEWETVGDSTWILIREEDPAYHLSSDLWCLPPGLMAHKSGSVQIVRGFPWEDEGLMTLPSSV